MPITLQPIYQPYGNVRNSFQQIMGESGNTGPIQYNVPLSSMRNSQGQTNINPNGGEETPEDRINREAFSIAEKRMGQFRADGAFMQLMDPSRAAGLDNYRLTPYEQNNYNKLQQAGYSQDYSLANAGSGAGASYRPNSIEGQFIQGSFDRDQRDRNAGWALTGYQPSSQVQRAYQNLLNRI